MLSVKECEKYLEKYNLSYEEIEEIRNVLYCISENIIENYIQNKKVKIKKEYEKRIFIGMQ